jgi:hypothetical protein
VAKGIKRKKRGKKQKEIGLKYNFFKYFGISIRMPKAFAAKNFVVGSRNKIAFCTGGVTEMAIMAADASFLKNN